MLSLNLPDNRFIALHPLTKKPKGLAWQTHPINRAEAEAVLKAGGNVGLLLGNGLICLDCDSPELAQAVSSLPPTYTQISAKRQLPQLFYKCAILSKVNIQNSKKNYGEILATGQQVVLSPSKYAVISNDIRKEPSLNLRVGEVRQYSIKTDMPIVTITPAEIIQVLKDFPHTLKLEAIFSEQTAYPTLEKDISILDVLATSGMKKDKQGQYYGSNPWHGSTTNQNFYISPQKNLAYCFRCNTAISPIKCLALNENIIHSCTDSLTGENFKQALRIAQQKNLISHTQSLNELKDISLPVVAQDKPLCLKTYTDFLNLKKDKSFLCQGIISPVTTNILYSPPAHFKSLVALDLAICIATGKPFLQQQTKKNAVLLCDAENNEQTIKSRWQALHKGQNIKRKKYPLFILKSGTLINEKKYVDEFFFGKLKDAIRKHNIKFLIFDTLHRFAYYDENSSDNLNLLYTKIFTPLMNEFGLSILILHHSTKPDRTGRRTYRGSSDLMGQVDSAWTLYKSKNAFSLVCEKSRQSELKTLHGEIDFGKLPNGELDYIKINRVSQTQEQPVLNKLKEVTQRIKDFATKRQEKLWKRKDLIEDFELSSFNFGCMKTIQRALNWLVENQYLNNEAGAYGLILR